MSMHRQSVGLALVSAAVGLLASVGQVAALDDVTVQVATWSSDAGHGYVGVKANGNWAPPASRRIQVQTEFFTRWQNMGDPGAYCHAWWVSVVRAADGSVVNPDSPTSLVRCGPEPIIGVTPEAVGDLSMYLAVAVDPVTAPARTSRAVTAELTAGWRDWVDDAINAYIRRDSVRVTRWTVDFGDGMVQTYPGATAVPDTLTTTHAYDAGQFDVIVTAHVVGDAYGAFFAPDGTPYERVVPFALDISNRASGVAALPIEYLPPVVTVGGSPSGTLPGGVPIPADTAGHPALYWPRGLPCDLFVRPIIATEGVMRSGGVVIGGGTTRLVSYQYEAGANDASGPTRTGTYPADAPIHLQWDTPLPGTGTYPVRLVLELETTYGDGTVRTSQAAGTVRVAVIYSAVSQ